MLPFSLQSYSLPHNFIFSRANCSAAEYISCVCVCAYICCSLFRIFCFATQRMSESLAPKKAEKRWRSLLLKDTYRFLQSYILYCASGFTEKSRVANEFNMSSEFLMNDLQPINSAGKVASPVNIKEALCQAQKLILLGEKGLFFIQRSYSLL